MLTLPYGTVYVVSYKPEPLLDQCGHEGSQCTLCPGVLDHLGHHAVTCKYGGDVVSRHNKIRDILVETCRRAHIGVQVEVGNNLTHDHNKTRPADILLSNWFLGKPAALDVSITSPLNPLTLLEAGVLAKSAAQVTEARKHQANDPKCSELGWVCVPMVAESYGAWGDEASSIISSIASRLATSTCKSKSLVDRKKDSGQLQVSHAVSLSQDGLFGKACNVLVSCGIAPNSDETWNLLVSKHPKSDCPSVPGLPQNDVSLPSSLNLMAILRSFPKLSAAGPSGLRIQHLIDAAEITLQTPILHLLRKVINILASGKAPVDVSIFLAGGNLTALQKSKPGCPLDVRPIAVGEALRRLVGKCLCSMLKSKAAKFFDPLQRGVACAAGAEKIAHGLRGCMDENWQAEGFTVLKIDLVNAFNLVSRHALLSECTTHFPELLPWVSWCYSRHPVLWHTLGNLTSQSGVQQGDPLGPLLFSLVLNVVVKAIATHPECSDLSYHVWYLDDGVLAGPSLHVRKALSLLIELGPPLGLHVNIKKCEVFSSVCLSHFPMEMKQSSKPNLEILGIPIGDSVFCRAVLDRKRSEAGVLLKRLEDVGEVDPQVALVLLRLCGGYCKLVHLARAVPPSFSQSVLQLFDQDVQKCFTSCTGVHPSIAAWKQAQLSLSRGGLGLRSLSHHAPAAFIASLCFSGLGSISHVHLLQSLEIFNSSVHQSDNIQIGSVLEKLPSQKTLSSILDDNLFRVLQGSLSIADRARLLSASSPHASSWLTVTPSEGQGLHLDPPVFQTALKWWLGLDTAEGSICALCPDKMLDPLGHHATTCKRGGDVVFRHNKLRDILSETCRRAHLSVQVEAGCNLTPDHSHSRPADVLISNWVLGKTAACDISVTSPLNSNIMSEAGVTAGAAAQATELRKHEANDVKCSELGWLCIPLVVESYGAWGKEAMESFSSLASRLAITSSRPKSAVLSELYGWLNLNLSTQGVRIACRVMSEGYYTALLKSSTKTETKLELVALNNQEGH
eukprot:Em0011g934a